MEISRRYDKNTTTFGAKIIICDSHNAIPNKIKKHLTNMCHNLGNDFDEIVLQVENANNKPGKVEKDLFRVIINETVNPECSAKSINKYKYLPIWIGHKYSIPRNLTKIFEDLILPAFKIDEKIIDRMHENIIYTLSK